jgi:sec-independent protein translocase protein TatA
VAPVKGGFHLLEGMLDRCIKVGAAEFLHLSGFFTALISNCGPSLASDKEVPDPFRHDDLSFTDACGGVLLTKMNTPTIAFIQGIGGPELLIILVIILLLFGAKKLPELARGLGKSMKEFKKATQEVQEDFQEAMDSVDTEKQPKSPPKAAPQKETEPAEPKDSGTGD